MKTIVVADRRISFREIDFTNLLQREFGYSLTYAKGLTDVLLAREPVRIDVADDQLEAFGELGAVFHEDGF